MNLTNRCNFCSEETHKVSTNFTLGPLVDLGMEILYDLKIKSKFLMTDSAVFFLTMQPLELPFHEELRMLYLLIL